jgi:hypothetical protein
MSRRRWMAFWIATAAAGPYSSRCRCAARPDRSFLGAHI